MGHKHTKAEILDGALASAFDDGLSQLTFGRLAKRLGISDRIVVYYFPTKTELVSETMTAVGSELQKTLGEAFGRPARDHRELVAQAWPVLTTAAADAVFAVYFEAAGLATAGREPYRTLVPRLIEFWITWAAGFIDGNDDERRTEAEASVAVIDGLLLLRQLAGPESAERAARRLRTG